MSLEPLDVILVRHAAPVESWTPGYADHDRRERRLSKAPLDDWRSTLEQAWTDADFAPPGGETGRDAQRRAVGTLDLLRSRHPDGGRLVLGSHGNLIGLILQALEPGVDFAFP